MKLNVLNLSLPARPRTHEGASAVTLTSEQSLRRSVLACMLWENEFYESGETIAARIRALVPQVAPETVAALAVEARTAMKLRHVPLLLVREMARYAAHRALVAETLVRVIQRADELTEFLTIYWADGRAPLAASVVFRAARKRSPRCSGRPSSPPNVPRNCVLREWSTTGTSTPPGRQMYARLVRAAPGRGAESWSS